MDKPATPLPWAYRPQEHDDWGIIRMSGRDEDGFMRVVCRVNYVASPEELSAHRMAGTDPAGQDAAYIVTACNAYPHLTAINTQLVGTVNGLLSIIIDGGLADDLVAQIYPDAKRKNGQPASEFAKSVRRAINEARTALARAKENSNGH